jgi:hypothetical protein
MHAHARGRHFLLKLWCCKMLKRYSSYGTTRDNLCFSKWENPEQSVCRRKMMSLEHNRTSAQAPEAIIKISDTQTCRLDFKQAQSRKNGAGIDETSTNKSADITSLLPQAAVREGPVVQLEPLPPRIGILARRRRTPRPQPAAGTTPLAAAATGCDASMDAVETMATASPPRLPEHAEPERGCGIQTCPDRAVTLSRAAVTTTSPADPANGPDPRQARPGIPSESCAAAPPARPGRDSPGPGPGQPRPTAPLATETRRAGGRRRRLRERRGFDQT